MLIFLIILSTILFTPYAAEWLSIDIEVIFLQTLMLYYIMRLGMVKNLFQLAGYSALVLITLGIYLFWLQFDVFACFLLVAESIVILFMVSLLMHLNYTNLKNLTKTNWIVFLILPTLVNLFITNSQYNYWVDWYSSQISQYNDLLPQYIYFYTIDNGVVLLTALWLLVLTFLLVHLILNVHVSMGSNITTLTYTRKTQNIWSQWYKKPLIRFFKK